jgi:hypothetical protein
MVSLVSGRVRQKRNSWESADDGDTTFDLLLEESTSISVPNREKQYSTREPNLIKPNSFACSNLVPFGHIVAYLASEFARYLTARSISIPSSCSSHDRVAFVSSRRIPGAMPRRYLPGWDF